VDDARLLGEGGGGEEDERGDESELSHVALDRAAARRLADRIDRVVERSLAESVQSSGMRL
jgi:hypothetical protein